MIFGKLILTFGGNLKAIAKFLNTNSKIVYSELKRFGIAGPPLGRPQTPLDTDELRRLYVHEALSVREVAARMNVCACKVRMELDHAGIEVRRYSAPAIFPTERFIKIGEHLPASDLPEFARQYGIRLETKLVRGTATLVVGMAEISRLYHAEMLTIAAISRLLGITPPAIHHHRSSGHLFLEKRRERRKKTLDSDALRHLYVEKRLTMKDVAERLDTSSGIVARDRPIEYQRAFPSSRTDADRR